MLVETRSDLNMRSSKGARTGTVKDTATRRQIGLESTFLEWGFNSNHFSVDNSELGLFKSSREIEVVPIVLANVAIFGFNLDISVKVSSPVGSHVKLALCFLPDTD